jgi:hypothetical protein
MLCHIDFTKQALFEKSWKGHSLSEAAVASTNADLLSRRVRVDTEIKGGSEPMLTMTLVDWFMY